jgi:hypothetical protein
LEVDVAFLEQPASSTNLSADRAERRRIVMPRRLSTPVIIAVALIVGAVGARAQSSPRASGHWEGAIQIPGQELKVEVDLAPAGEQWEGSINIPAQSLKGFPLSSISVQADAVTFVMRGVPGEPTFKGTVSKDGKQLSGDFSQGGGTVPFSLTRSGDAKVERPAKSTPVTKELEGSWHGTLDVAGKTLRLVVKLANKPEGAAAGTMVSVDQGGVEIPIASIVQTGSRLTLALPTIAGSYDGELKGGVLTGKWTQGPNTWPLEFKKQ